MNWYIAIPVSIGLLIELTASAIYLWGELTNPEMKVHPLAWFGLAGIMTVGTWATTSLGATWGIYVLWVMTFGTWLVFLVSLYYWLFMRHRIYKPETADWALACVGTALLALRATVLSPLPAAIVSVIGDSCFIVLILLKLWDKPDSEGWHGKWNWTLTTVATIIAAFTVDAYTVSTLLYPVYIVLSTGLLAAACWGWTPGKEPYNRFQAWRKSHKSPSKKRVSRA